MFIIQNDGQNIERSLDVSDLHCQKEYIFPLHKKEVFNFDANVTTGVVACALVKTRSKSIGTDGQRPFDSL